MRPGDRILTVDGEVVGGKNGVTVDGVKDRLRGTPGTKVTLALTLALALTLTITLTLTLPLTLSLTLTLPLTLTLTLTKVIVVVAREGAPESSKNTKGELAFELQRKEVS